ncbi:MAG: helix-turn-helix domain-containing protein [Limisphaerales bacterium]
MRHTFAGRGAESKPTDCPEHGVKTMQVPWAEPQGRFTLLFEKFALEVLQAAASVSQACELLGIGWETAHEIMRRAVERGLERRQLEGLRHLGMDEKSFGRGQSYITLLTDVEGGEGEALAALSKVGLILLPRPSATVSNRNR